MTGGWFAQTGGVALIAVGFAGFILGFFTDLQTVGGHQVALMLAGGQAMIMGTLLYCYEQLLVRSMRNEDALQFQYDIGYEAGYQDRERLARPVLIDLEERRISAAQKAAVKVSERV